MGIDESNPIWKQIYWIDESRCLRPMLAPNLYTLLEILQKFIRPLKIFEVGTCFRRESKGKIHLEEFTMLNAVELAPPKDPSSRLKELIELIMRTLKLDNYILNNVESDIYGHTTDVIVNGLEIASSAEGPITMDQNWGITEPWVGIGIGLERICSSIVRSSSVKPYSRNLGYIDGKCINI